MISNEIFETELTYVRGLLTVHKSFVLPLRQRVRLGDPILTTEQIEKLFFQIKEIMMVRNGLSDN